MGQNSKIEWTQDTDNVFVVWDDEEGKQAGWHCVKVSEGCQHCYAETLNVSGRFNGNGMPYRKTLKEGQLTFWGAGNEHLSLHIRHDIMSKWERQTKPRLHFINSMTDTFGEFIPDEWVFALFDAMSNAPLQTFQVLTKRADRMLALTDEWLYDNQLAVLPDNIWMMVTVENQERANERIPHLLKTKARVRGVSVEPMLGAVSLDEYWQEEEGFTYSTWLDYLDWVIVGGESGDKARPMHPEWASNLIAQCKAKDVPVMFKQWGEYVPHRFDCHHDYDEFCKSHPYATHGVRAYEDDFTPFEVVKVGKKKAGRLINNREYNDMPKAWHGGNNG